MCQTGFFCCLNFYYSTQFIALWYFCQYQKIKYKQEKYTATAKRSKFYLFIFSFFGFFVQTHFFFFEIKNNSSANPIFYSGCIFIINKFRSGLSTDKNDVGNKFYFHLTLSLLRAYMYTFISI